MTDDALIEFERSSLPHRWKRISNGPGCCVASVVPGTPSTAICSGLPVTGRILSHG
jgi:hypothetical protein